MEDPIIPVIPDNQIPPSSYHSLRRFSSKRSLLSLFGLLIIGIFIFLGYEYGVKRLQTIRSRATGNSYSVTATVSTGTMPLVAESIWGVNFFPMTRNINDVATLLPRYNIAAAQTLGIRSIRYAGGCWGDTLNPIPQGNALISKYNQNGTDSIRYLPALAQLFVFLNQINPQIKIIYQVNTETKALTNPCGLKSLYPNILTNGVWDEAKNEAQLLADLINVITTHGNVIDDYELGNEQWNSWDPNQYITTATRFAQVIKQYDPTAKVGLVGYPTSFNNQTDTIDYQANLAWTTTIKNHLNDQCAGKSCFDFVTDHPYEYIGYQSQSDRAIINPPPIPDGTGGTLPIYQYILASLLDVRDQAVYSYICPVSFRYGNFKGQHCTWFSSANMSQIRAGSTYKGFESFVYFYNNNEYIKQILLDSNGYTTYVRSCSVNSTTGLTSAWPIACSGGTWETGSWANLRGVGNEKYTDMNMLVYVDGSNHQKIRQRFADGTANIYERTCDLVNGSGANCQAFSSINAIGAPVVGLGSYLFRSNGDFFQNPKQRFFESLLQPYDAVNQTQKLQQRQCEIDNGSIVNCGSFQSYEITKARQIQPLGSEQYAALNHTSIYANNGNLYQFPTNIPGYLAYYAAKEAGDKMGQRITDYNPKSLALTEWNLRCWGPSYNTGVGTVDHGFFTAETLLQMAKTGVQRGIYHDYTETANSSNAGCSLFQTQTSANYLFKSTGNAFSLTSVIAGGKMLNTGLAGVPQIWITEDKRCNGGGCLNGGYSINVLSAYAALSADNFNIYLYFLNRDTSRSASVKIYAPPIPNIISPNRYTAKTLQGSDFASLNFSVIEEGAPQVFTSGTTTVSVPPVSIMRVKLFHMMPPPPTQPPPATPTATLVPCDQPCNYGEDNQCQSGLLCYRITETCRNLSCASQTNCICSTPTPTPTLPPLVCPPGLTGPADGTIFTSRPTYYWTSCIGAVSYYLSVSGPGVNVFSAIGSTHSRPTVGYADGKQYTWKVKGCYDASCTSTSDWSISRSIWWQQPPIPTSTTGEHTECVNNICSWVSGAGSNQCIIGPSCGY